MSGVRISRSFSYLLCGAVTTSLIACNPQSRSDLATGTRAAELDACTAAVADGEWTSQALNPQTGAFAVELSATPSESPIDAVIGLSAGEASWFPQLAAIVRFNPDGMIDVRAGSDYQADVEFRYTAGTQYAFHLELNVALHVYSVAVLNPAGGWTWLARSYPFRTEQAEVAQLDNLATFVDSDSGAIDVCNVRITTVHTEDCPGPVAGGGFVDDEGQGNRSVADADHDRHLVVLQQQGDLLEIVVRAPWEMLDRELERAFAHRQRVQQNYSAAASRGRIGRLGCLPDRRVDRLIRRR